MSRRIAVLLVGLSALFLAAPGGAGTATPIYAPTSITASGTYQVVTSFASSTANAIDIVGATGTEDVVIDLNGKTISISGGYNAINATNIATLVVSNGTIVDPTTPNGHGIWMSGGVSATIDNVEVKQTDLGIYLANVAIVQVTNCTIYGPQTNGIEVDGAGLGSLMQGEIKWNQVQGAGTGGILVSNNHANVVVAENTVQSVASGPGIYIFSGTAATVDQNRVRLATTGIELDVMSGCLVTGNTVGGSGGDGIVLTATDNSSLDNNFSVNNGAHGMRVAGDHNTFTNNRLNRNAGHGLWFEAPAGNNFFQDNVARGNTGAAAGGACPAPACAGLTSPDFCNDGTMNASGAGNWMPGPPAC